MKTALFSPLPWVGICLAALVFRMTLGIDLGDESYYAAFIDGWLKTGLGGNAFLMVHQTAALLVYPFAYLYSEVRGDADGLVLFLRFVYLALAAASALCLYRAVALHRGRTLATLATILSLLFIPFSLPAPSYNTIGMYALVAALSLFACGYTRSLEAAGDSGLSLLSPVLWLSAFWWAVGCTAYPPLIAPLVALLVLSFAFLHAKPERRWLLRYALACAVMLALAFVVLWVALGHAHLLQMLRFTNAFNNVSGGIGGKVRTALDAFAAHPRLALICLAATVLSALRCLRASRWRLLCDIGTGLLVIAVATAPAPTFYSRTHDLVLVLALSGIFHGARELIRRTGERRTRVLALLYVVSLLGGIATAAMAFNGLFNFPIGGLLAATLALAIPERSTRPERAAGYAITALACAAMAATAFTTYYGQIGSFAYRHSVRVGQGAFAGLRTDADQAVFIERLGAAIERQQGCGTRFAVLGTGPGFYLLTSMSPSTVSSWNFPGDARNFATDTLRAFYQVPKNRPDVIVVNNWQWATPLSSSDRALLERYALAEKVTVGIRNASVYRRADCDGSGE